MRVILLAFASIGLPYGFCSSNDLHPAEAPLALLPSAPHGPAPVHLEKSLQETPAPSIGRLEIERRQAEVDSTCGYWSDTDSSTHAIYCSYGIPCVTDRRYPIDIIWCSNYGSYPITRVFDYTPNSECLLGELCCNEDSPYWAEYLYNDGVAVQYACREFYQPSTIYAVTALPPATLGLSTPTASAIVESRSNTASSYGSTFPETTSTPVSTLTVTIPNIPSTTPDLTLTSTAPTAASSTSPSSSTPASTSGLGSSWESSIKNWHDANTDVELLDWWNNNLTESQRESTSLVELLTTLSGIPNVQCGIGDTETCTLSECTGFSEKWMYLVCVALIEMNELFNNIENAMVGAEAEVNPIIPPLATLFPLPPNHSPFHHALPWIETFVTVVLAFVPLAGEILGAGDLTEAILGGISAAAAALVNAGLSQLHAFKNASNRFDNWTTTVLQGTGDTNGANLIKYLAMGRFSDVQGNEDPIKLTEYLSDIVVAKVVNEEWRKNSIVYIMCANSTDIPCEETSRFIDTNENRSCCLYRLDSNMTYATPIQLNALMESPYNVEPTTIVNSSVRTYMAAKFNYDQSDFFTALSTNIVSNPSSQALQQGSSFEGIWDIPVCDVGVNANWVANYTKRLMPCCCGVDCSETQDFIKAANISNINAMNNLCDKQDPGHIKFSMASTQLPGLGHYLIFPLLLLVLTVLV